MAGPGEVTRGSDLNLPRPAGRFELTLSDGERGFLFDHQTGDLFTLNRTGALVVQYLLDGSTPQTIARRLAEMYGIPLEQAMGDIEAFVAETTDIGIFDERS